MRLYLPDGRQACLTAGEHINQTSEVSNDLPILRIDGMNVAIDFMIINAQNLFTKMMLTLSSLLGSYYFFDNGSFCPYRIRGHTLIL